MISLIGIIIASVLITTVIVAFGNGIGWGKYMTTKEKIYMMLWGLVVMISPIVLIVWAKSISFVYCYVFPLAKECI